MLVPKEGIREAIMRAYVIVLALFLTLLFGAVGAYEVGFTALTIIPFVLGLSAVAYAGLSLFEPALFEPARSGRTS